MIASRILNSSPGYLIDFLIGTLQGIAEMVMNASSRSTAEHARRVQFW
jgi:hypothetical protein